MRGFIKTVTSEGGTSSGGSTGLSVKDVCNTICTLSTQDVANQPSPRISQGFSCWEMLCNCPSWDDCYGCCMIWNVDTMKYKAFRLRYNGIRVCACCYQYIMPGVGNDVCFCCCDQAWRGRCLCGWPTRSCCNWEAFNCCSMAMYACIYCCNTQWDDIWSFDWTIWQAPWRACCCPGNSIYYKFCYKKWVREDQNQYDYMSWDTSMGRNFCSCLHWNCVQAGCFGNCDNRYMQRLCLKVCNTPFMSALFGGTYPCHHGCSSAVGDPCWTIYGSPCDRPMMGTCSMDNSVS